MTMTLLKRRQFLKTMAVLPVGAVAVAAEPEDQKGSDFTVVVMDPLAAPLSCPCVKGYAQRDYTKLGQYLETKLGRQVKVFFGESLTNTLAKKSGGKADLIIGKESVVRHEVKENKLDAVPVAALTGKDGKTTQTGLVVVAAKDPALSAADLSGYQVILGDKSADEKHTAALSLFKDLGVKLPGKLETCLACSDGATKVIDSSKKGEKIATVISSYAQPLLEGCGTIQKGDLRVVGETDPIPFIVAFVSESQSESIRTVVQKALLGMASEKALLTALETKNGFVELPTKKK